MPTKDGGSAFPCPGGEFTPNKEDMSLRDYFAGTALQGVLSNFGVTERSWGDLKAVAKAVAASSYLMADAMLAERNKQP